MALMLAKTSAGYSAAGAFETETQATAEKLADYDKRIEAIEKRLGSIDGKLTVLPVAVAINAPATIASFGMLWQLTALAWRHSEGEGRRG